MSTNPYILVLYYSKSGAVAQLANYLARGVESVAGMVHYKGLILTHCPIHPMELDHRFNKNIHGHIHEKFVMLGDDIDPRYFCVSCEHVDYTPKTLEELGIKR